MISYEDFITSCKLFIDQAHKLDDPWELVDKGEKDKVFLVKRKHLLQTDPKQLILGVLDEGENELEELNFDCEDDPLCLKKKIEEVLIMELHIVYNIAYSVPVFYFKVLNQNGTELSLDSILEILCARSREIAKDKFKTVSQSYHPIEGSPFYYIHPCNTSEVMKPLTDGKTSNSKMDVLRFYIPNWLSIYGRYFGLIVPIEYFIQ